MKRSEINRRLEDGKGFFDKLGFNLPPFAFFGIDEWRGLTSSGAGGEITDLRLGWDITTFGSGDFISEGLLLFTLRNGMPGKYPKNYAEKVMMVLEEQVTPCHFHWKKREDIINRGGGELVFECWKASADDRLSDEPFSLSVDGVRRELKPGGKLILRPGESVCFEPYYAHRFYAAKGSGPVMAGEVSSVNDDSSDNCFIEKKIRFDEIEEDAPPLHLLAADYPRYLGVG